jgi:AcrR family transcriptional regulator
MRLFQTQGYAATTVEQIAEAVEISPSTFFRYFSTKEAVVLTDEYDPLLIAAFKAQPAELGPITALRRAFAEVFAALPAEQVAQERERQALILSVPELRAGMLDALGQTVQMLAEVVAERIGRRADELAVRSLAGAVIGVSLAAMLAAVEDPSADIVALLDEAMAHLEAGLQL